MPTRGANSTAFAEGTEAHRGNRFSAPLRCVRWLALVLALALCWEAAEVRPQVLFDPASLAASFSFLSSLFPPDTSLHFLGVVLKAIAQTLAIAVAGTALSVAIGLPLGFFSTASLWRRSDVQEEHGEGAFSNRLGALTSRATRGLLGFLRAVPDLVWGLLFVAAVGLGSLAGALGLAVAYAGVLGRVYSDVFEDVDPRPSEALRASGATRAQIFLRAIWPQAIPNVTAYTLYSFECSVRAAAVLGLVGAGGLGYEINLSMRLFEYGQVSTLIIALILLLTATDAVSRFVRRRLNGEAQHPSRGRWLSMLIPPRLLKRRNEAERRPFAPSSNFYLLLAAVASTFASLYYVNFFNAALAEGETYTRIERFVGRMLPPDIDPAFLAGLLTPLTQTVGISVVGTLIGVGLGASLALLAVSTLMLSSRNLNDGRTRFERLLRWLVFHAVRLVYTLLRSVPELIWVLILIMAVGLGPFAGALALGLHTGGVLGKLYAETLEEAPRGPVEAMRAGGATPFQILLWGLWPQARPMLVSYTVLRWEMNLRVSTVLGLVGGGGLGQAIYNNVQLGFYGRVSTLILIVYALVLVADRAGENFRRSMATA